MCLISLYYFSAFLTVYDDLFWPSSLYTLFTNWVRLGMKLLLWNVNNLVEISQQMKSKGMSCFKRTSI